MLKTRQARHSKGPQNLWKNIPAMRNPLEMIFDQFDFGTRIRCVNNTLILCYCFDGYQLGEHGAVD